MADTIKYGTQGSASKSISYGIQKGDTSEFDRRPNRGDKEAVYKFDKQSGSGPSGHAQTQSKGLGKHSSIGGNSNFVPKGKVSGFKSASGKWGTMKTGLSAQTKGHGA
jgi:hypothetical protein